MVLCTCTFAFANGEARHAFEAQQAMLPTKRGLYARFMPEEKAEVGKRAVLPVEHGVVATLLGLHVHMYMALHVLYAKTVQQ